MKKSYAILTKAKLLTSPQMDRTLPRGSVRSLRTSSPILGHHPSSSPAPITLLLSSLISFHNNTFSKSTMEKQPQDIKEAGKDQLREGFCKEAYDYKSPKGVSDYILPHILNLYASRAMPQDFEIYAPNATFEDPLMCAHGVKQIKSAFYSLAKVFSESRIVDYTIKENEISRGKTEILIDNKQYYKFLGKDIDVISLIKLYTEDGKVVRHEDWWDKKPLWNRETVTMPLVGRIVETTRRASMLATHALMRFGKDPNM
ncbi:hypothetical protein CDL12_12496 [Handroanthus impetiginosus]|uniref:SnoaL-like domain-containing protein n=1 Tax=Handroanthus impetiginosus TaxID=429701 RepID=A0A2G9HBG2_9LAMI|nr:hypothetical protein CDL12_12496 [Handroanthus impetiginosus]